MYSCEEVKSLYNFWHEGQLEPAAEEAVSLHLFNCHACQMELAAGVVLDAEDDNIMRLPGLQLVITWALGLFIGTCILLIWLQIDRDYSLNWQIEKLHTDSPLLIDSGNIAIHRQSDALRFLEFVDQYTGKVTWRSKEPLAGGLTPGLDWFYSWGEIRDGGDPVLMALHGADGSLVWQATVPIHGDELPKITFRRNRLFFFNGHGLVCVDAISGKFLWQSDSGLVEAGGLDVIFSGTRLFCALDGALLELDWETGRLVRTFRVPLGEERVTNNQLYLHGQNLILVVDTDLTRSIWAFNTIGNVFIWNRQLPLDATIYPAGEVMVSASQKGVKALSLIDGRIMWEKQLQPPTIYEFANNKIYWMTTDKGDEVILRTLAIDDGTENEPPRLVSERAVAKARISGTNAFFLYEDGTLEARRLSDLTR